MHRKLTWLMTTALVAATALPAFAQDTSDQNVDEIIVTGQKIERSLQDTATSVAIVTDLDIAEKNIIDLTDAIDQTANVTTREGSTFVIRGINSLNVSGAGQSDLATIYVDGSPLTRDATLSGPLDVWDLEQIEIFRGPQSTLQGRNALAGAIIINTAQPTYDWEGRLRAIIGTNNQKRLGAAFGGPIIEDQVAFRVAWENSEADGFVDNVTTGGTDDARKANFVRAKLLIEPNNIPDLSINLGYTHDDRNFGDTLASLSVNDPASNRTSFSNRPYQDDVTVEIATAKIDYDFTDNLSLTSVSSYNKSVRDRRGDTDRTAQDEEFFTQEADAKTFTQEVRLQYAKDNFEGLLGGYYADVKRDVVNNSTFGLEVLNQFNLVPTVAGLVQRQIQPAIVAQLVAAGLPQAAAEQRAAQIAAQQAQSIATQTGQFYAGGIDINAKSVSPVNLESYALFGDFKYDLNETLSIFGGFRYDFEQQDVVTGNEVSILRGLPDPTAVPAQLAPIITQVNRLLSAAALDATVQEATAQSPTFEAFLPKLGIGWNIDDYRTLNFMVQRGYRSGGVGVNSARAQTFIFDPEYTWNYEASFRSQWLDNRLTLNANAFFIDWEDQQVNVQLSRNVFDTETQNAGSSQVKGFEIEASYAATDNLDIYGSVGVADSEFKQFFANVAGQRIDLSGNTFAAAPGLTLAGGATWKNTRGWIANVNGNYNSASFNRSDRPQGEKLLNDRFLANFRVGWQNERFGIFATGNNVFDATYINTIFPADPLQPNVAPEFARYGDPQTFALQLEARF